jgi:hypothetical protein
MATTNRERVGKALDLLMLGLRSFIDREIGRDRIQVLRVESAKLQQFLQRHEISDNKPVTEWDAAALPGLMGVMWNDVFAWSWSWSERLFVRSFVGELRGHRNRWAHQETFSDDDTYRAVDTAQRLLTAVEAPQAADVEKLKSDLQARFYEQARGARDKRDGLLIDNAAITQADAADFWLGSEIHAPGERGDYAQQTLCGLDVYHDGSVVDGGRVVTPERLVDVDCIVCRDIMGPVNQEIP